MTIIRPVREDRVGEWDQSNGQRRRLLVVHPLVVLLTTSGFEVAVGTGESMGFRSQPRDLVLVHTTRDTVSAVHVHDTIAYRSGPGLFGYEMVVITVDQDPVLARAGNRETLDRVTSEMLVGMAVAHVDRSAVCSALG